MIWKYGTEATGYINVISQLKVKIHNCSIELKNYEIKREQFQQKRTFRTNAFQLQKELNRTGKEEYISLDPDEAKNFGLISRVYNLPITRMPGGYKG